MDLQGCWCSTIFQIFIKSHHIIDDKNRAMTYLHRLQCQPRINAGFLLVTFSKLSLEECCRIVHLSLRETPPHHKPQHGTIKYATIWWTISMRDLQHWLAHKQIYSMHVFNRSSLKLLREQLWRGRWTAEILLGQNIPWASERTMRHSSQDQTLHNNKD